MTALRALVRRDLILYVSDRRAWTLNLVMRIVLGAFFGYLFGGAGVDGHARITVGLATQDTSPDAGSSTCGAPTRRSALPW